MRPPPLAFGDDDGDRSARLSSLTPLHPLSSLLPQLTDICIKNGGDHFLAEVASREFMDNLVSVLKNPKGVNHDVKTKALRLIQDWAQVSEAKPAQMSYIIEVYRSLKAEGLDFPPASIASAAFVETLTAPEWVDGEVCMRCRTAFSTFNRKHHCRNCGNVFCQQCSSHNMALPWYGIGQDVRVCDGCFAKKAPPKGIPASGSKLNRSVSSSSPLVVPSGRGGAASHHRSSTLHSKSKRSKREEDDIALAIRLSLQDSGGAVASSSSSEPHASMPSAPRATKQANGRMLEGTDADDDPDLAAAIAASLRDYAPPQPSAPAGLDEDEGAYQAASRGPYQEESQQPTSHLPLPPSLELPPGDVDAILTFAQTTRNQEENARRQGHPGLQPDYQLQLAHDKASGARPKMARSLDEAGRRHGVLMSMHDKLSEAVRLYDQLLDARLARPAYAPAGYGYPGQQDQYAQYQQGPSYHNHQSQPYQQHLQQQQPYPPQQDWSNHAPPQQSYAQPGGEYQQPPVSAQGGMYPSLPQTNQPQEPYMNGSGPSHHQYAEAAGAPPLSPSVSLRSPQQRQVSQSSVYSNQAGEQQPYYPSQQQPWSPQQTGGYAQEPSYQGHPAQAAPGAPSQYASQQSGPSSVVSQGPAEPLDSFQKRMSPSQSKSVLSPPPSTTTTEEEAQAVSAVQQNESIEAQLAALNMNVAPTNPLPSFSEPSQEQQHNPWTQQAKPREEVAALIEL